MLVLILTATLSDKFNVPPIAALIPSNDVSIAATFAYSFIEVKSLVVASVFIVLELYLNPNWIFVLLLLSAWLMKKK